MRAKSTKFWMAALCLAGLSVSLPAQEGFYEERFSLYGYLVNLFNVNLESEDWRVSGSEYGNVLYGRLKGDWNPESSLRFHAELAYDARVGNRNPYVLYQSYGFALLDGPATVETETQADYPTEDFIQSVSVDHLWGSVSLGRFDLQFGKLPLAWGTGYFSNPTSRAASAAFLEIVSEETPGTLAVAPSVSFLEGRLSLQGYAAFQDKSHKRLAFQSDGEWENLPFGLKVQGIVGSFDLSASLIKEVAYTSGGINRHHFLGADLVGAVWDFGVYAEAALRLPWDAEARRFDCTGETLSDLIEASLGFDYVIPVLEVDTRLEYYHYGPGERRKSAYDVMGLLQGEQVVLAEDYLLFNLERGFLDYFKVSAAGLVNMNDGSLAVIPEIGGEPYGNLEVGLGAMLFWGPAGSEYNGEFDLGSPIDLTEPAVYARCKLSF